jgi:hypothetical protein
MQLGRILNRLVSAKEVKNFFFGKQYGKIWAKRERMSKKMRENSK